MNVNYDRLNKQSHILKKKKKKYSFSMTILKIMHLIYQITKNLNSSI